jgi:hypothetical protein
VTAGEQSIARLAALTRFFTMFAVAVSVPTAVAFTFVTAGDASLAEVGARIAGHIAATLLGAAFVFFSLVAAQLALAAAGGPAAVRVATWPLQAAALVAMVGALSFTTRLADVLVAPDASASPWVSWNPAAWFIGMYRWLAGDPRQVFASLALRGVLASALAVVTTLVAYPMAYQRCVQQAIAGEGQRAGWWSGAVMRLWQRALALRLRTPLERGLASFITATLTRSPAHRFLIGGYFGVALLCALPMMPRLLGPASTVSAEYAWFSVPLGLLCWMAAAMRVAMMLPVEPGANWIVQLTEPVDKRRVLSTAAIVIESAVVIPLAAGFGAGAAVAGGVSLGAMVVLVVLGTGLALVQVLTLALRTVPCTCTYRPGQLRLRMLWPVYLLTWTLIAYRLPYVAVWALDDPSRSLGLVTALVAAGLGLRLWRLARARRLQSFIYDEGDASGATTMGLSSMKV